MFNRDGAVFDKGETFSGIDYEAGLVAVEELKAAFRGEDPAMLALRWVLSWYEVKSGIYWQFADQSTQLFSLDSPMIKMLRIPVRQAANPWTSKHRDHRYRRSDQRVGP